MRICDMKILELLYEEAKYNILKGRYPCDIQDCDVLAGIQARLELGPFNPQIHTAEFFRSKITDYLPEYACKNRWSFLSVSAKPGPEHRLLDRYRNIPTNTVRYKLLRKYLEFCWALPYYGSAFFHGQIEKPVKGLALLLDHYDKKVLIGINREGVHIIDAADHCLLLSMKFRNLSWDYASFKQENPDCLPCLFIQFKIPGQRGRDSKLMQIFSHQANMMDKLISKFVEELKQRPSWCEDQVDNFISIPHEDDDVYLFEINFVAAVAEWYRHRIVAGFVTSSSPVPLKDRRVGQRCTLNLSRAETSSRWCGVVVRRGGASSGVVHAT
ncbi:FERM domain-containing protein 8 [Trichonephila clavipes]|nr:FERM domain-containing protein 8 [Trichonephila clavipes]